MQIDLIRCASAFGEDYSFFTEEDENGNEIFEEDADIRYSILETISDMLCKTNDLTKEQLIDLGAKLHEIDNGLKISSKS